MSGYTLLAVPLALATTLPLAAKWELGVRRVGVAVAALAAVSALVLALVDTATAIGAVAATGAAWAMAMGAAIGILAHRFYRDPKRTPPAAESAIVSPADGEVIYVRESRGGLLPISTKHGRDYPLEELTRTPLRAEDAVVVGIGMSFLDVHVNRAPIEGRVTLRRHFPGLFGSLKHPEMTFENERATTVIERGELQVAVVQIASRLVRQIVGFVREGDDVSLAQRIGVIRLGSQVDLVLPARPDLRVTVQPGQRVRAGETVVAYIDHPTISS